MKTKLAAILALTTILLCQLQSQAQQPLVHYGYIGPTTDSDLSRVRSYTNFTYLDGVYGVSMVDTVNRVHNNGMRTLIDLGQVLWCPEPNDIWHLCGRYYGEVNYVSRWQSWVSTNGGVINSGNVLAFSVMTEHTKRQVPTSDVEQAISLVKAYYPTIPTLVSEGLVDVENPDFGVPYNVDWVALAAYYTHPNLDQRVSNAMYTIKSKKQSWQRTGYTLDGFHSDNHTQAGLTLDNMDTIAQEWYTFASRDPEAILIGVFSWYQAPDTGGIGSNLFPQHVLDKHAAIGQAILSGRYPSYQGNFDSIDCQTVRGFAWDTSQYYTPISVDIYDWSQLLGTVRADQPYSGIGNGLHGFSFTLPASIRNGQTHWITIRYSGLYDQLASSPRPISCAQYAGTVDGADCNSIVGWAADRNRLNTSISVSVYDGSTFVTSLLAGDYRPDVGAFLGDNGYHGFSLPTPARFRDGLQHTLRVKYESSATELNLSPKTLTCAASNASASIAWIQPAETSWGPANTMTVAGYAQNGSGGVQLVWRDASINGPWNTVAWQPTPGADTTWSNTIPSAYRCHTFQAYVNYSGAQSAIFTYTGVSSGYCNESTRVIWVQPQSTAGFGPPGSLVIAGSALNAPSGTQVYLWYRNVTLGTGWTQLSFAPLPGSDGIWYNSIADVNPYHQYQVAVTYDVINSSICTYAGTNSITWCQ